MKVLNVKFSMKIGILLTTPVTFATFFVRIAYRLVTPLSNEMVINYAKIQ